MPRLHMMARSEQVETGCFPCSLAHSRIFGRFVPATASEATANNDAITIRDRDMLIDSLRKDTKEGHALPDNWKNSLTMTSAYRAEIDTDSIGTVSTRRSIRSFKKASAEKLTANDMFEYGNKYAEEGNFKKAKESYRKALKKTSDAKLKIQIYLAMGNASAKQIDDESLIRKDRLELQLNTIFYYKLAVAIMSEDATDHNIVHVKAKLGNVFFRFGDLESASEQYSEAMAHASSIDKGMFSQMMYNYAMIKYQEKDFNEAQSFLMELLLCKESDDELLQQVPNYDIAYHIGISSFEIGEYDVGIKVFSNFLNDYYVNKPESGKYDVGKVHLMLADYYDKRSDDNENLHLAFIHYIKYLIYKDPEYLIRVQSGNSFEGKIDTEISKVFVRVGHMSFIAKDYFFAANCFKEAYYALDLSTKRSDLKLFRLVKKAYVSYIKADDTENGILMLKEIISILEGKQVSYDLAPDVQIADCYQDLGYIYKNSKNNRLAYTSFSRCLQLREKILSPEDVKVEKIQYEMSFCLYNDGKYDEAFDVCPHNSNDIDVGWRVFCLVGKIRTRQEDEDRSIAAFKAALELAKLCGENSLDVAAVLELLGRANMKFERFNESVDCYHDAYKIRIINEKSKAGDRLNFIRDMVCRYEKIEKFEEALMACSMILTTQQDMQLPDIEIASTMEIMGDIHCIVGDRNGYANGLALYHQASEKVKKQKHSSHELLIPIYLKMTNTLGLLDTKHPGFFLMKEISHDGLVKRISSLCMR